MYSILRCLHPSESICLCICPSTHLYASPAHVIITFPLAPRCSYAPMGTLSHAGRQPDAAWQKLLLLPRASPPQHAKWMPGMLACLGLIHRLDPVPPYPAEACQANPASSMAPACPPGHASPIPQNLIALLCAEALSPTLVRFTPSTLACL